MEPRLSYKIFPLGESAMTIDFGNVIDPHINNEIISLCDFFKDDLTPEIIEVVPAYSSLTIFYDLFAVRRIMKGEATAFLHMKEKVAKIINHGVVKKHLKQRTIRIPVCYHPEFALDIDKIAATKNLTRDDVINTHVSCSYRVYMLGFLPGFAYMGLVDESISFERKPEPENIKAGSVGIAGRQTGIYPLDSPGGWQIIGRTPLRIFNKDADHPALLHAGDIVQFYSISKDEFENSKSRYS